MYRFQMMKIFLLRFVAKLFLYDKTLNYKVI